MFHDDVEVKVDALVGHLDFDATTQAGSGQELGDAVRKGRGGHTNDTVALQRGISSHVGNNVICDGQPAGNGFSHVLAPYWLT